MVKKRNPTTPGQRFMTVADFGQLTRKKPEKQLTKAVKRRGGRNNHGRITARHRGGGSKRQLRLIDFCRVKDGVPARVAALEYDPNRSARIALLHYRDGAKAYILAPQGLTVGQEVISGEKVEPRVGNCLLLRHIPLGMSVHNVELQAGRGGQIIRSAGVGATLSAKEGRHAHLVMPSGEIRKVPLECRATVGMVGNSEHSSISVGKAGRNRWLGWRPYVRGVAMNPVAHPMGGGEGRSSGGRHPCSPQGRPAKGGKTRRRRKASNDLIIRRRKKKR